MRDREVDVPFSLGVVADDLTGAADCAARFATPAAPVAVVLDDRLDGGATILAVDTDSRWVHVAEAEARVAKAAQLMQSYGRPPYIKVDSLLRGHPVDTSYAAARRLGRPTVLLAPGLPDQRRKVVNGWLVVDGRRDHDILAMARTRFVNVRLIGLDVVRRGAGPIAAALRAARSPEVVCVVADSETAADLGALAAAARLVAPDVLPVGSAGLAAGFARAPRVRAPLAVPGAVTLLVVGSRSSAAAGQVRRLRSAGVPVTTIHPAAVVEVVVREVQAHFGRGGAAVVRLVPTDRDAAVDPVVARAYAARLATVARAAVDAGNVARLVLIGGDTARAVLVALDASGLLVSGSGPGSSCVGIVIGGPHAGMSIVTRAGAFGGSGSLLALAGAGTDDVKT